MSSISECVIDIFLCAAIEIHLVVLISFGRNQLPLPERMRNIKHTEMPEPIPLRTGLRIQRQHIIIHTSGGFMVNFVFEWSSIETRGFGLVQSPISTDSNTMFYFFRGSESVLRGKTIQHPQFICCAKKPPCIPPWTIFL